MRWPAPPRIRPRPFLSMWISFAPALALVALRGLHPQPAEPAHPDPGQDARDCRERPIEQLGDLRRAKAQPPQRRDRLEGALVGAVGHVMRRRGTIDETELPLGPVTRDPLRAR